MLILMALLAHPLAEAKVKLPEPFFTLMVHEKYSRPYYSFTKDEAKLICVTQDIPYIEATSDPLKNLDWKKLYWGMKGCTKDVTIVDERVKPARRGKFCRGTKNMQELISKIRVACKIDLPARD
jgi:hypothetical protein